MTKEYLKLIEAEIKNNKFGTEPKSLYEPIRYIMGLGGKRLRPLLAMLSYSLYKKDAHKIVSYATADSEGCVASWGSRPVGAGGARADHGASSR